MEKSKLVSVCLRTHESESEQCILPDFKFRSGSANDGASPRLQSVAACCTNWRCRCQNTVRTEVIGTKYGVSPISLVFTCSPDFVSVKSCGHSAVSAFSPHTTCESFSEERVNIGSYSLASHLFVDLTLWTTDFSLNFLRIRLLLVMIAVNSTPAWLSSCLCRPRCRVWMSIRH